MELKSETLLLVEEYFQEEEIKVEHFKRGNLNVYFKMTSMQADRVQVLQTSRGAEKKRELKKLFKLSKNLFHPNIETPIDSIPLNDNRHMILYEYRANSLEDVLSELDIYSFIKILQEVSEGLNYLAEEEIIHCELTPRNILLSNTGAKITNFSQACHLETLNTAKGGPIWYQSPELILERSPTPSTDVWSVGSILAEKLDKTLFLYFKKDQYFDDVSRGSLKLEVSNIDLKYLFLRIFEFDHTRRTTAKDLSVIFLLILSNLEVSASSPLREESKLSELSEILDVVN